jgi:glutamate--cysteine ligase
VNNLIRGVLTRDLRNAVFAGPFGASHPPRRIGAEVEFIPVESLTGQRCPIEVEGVTSTLPFLRRFGRRQGWRETRTAKGTPCFQLPAGGAITFEPGGQLEYSSPPCNTASQLLASLRDVVLPLRSAAAGEGIDLLAFGIDPLSSVEQSPLLIRAKRYERMATYFATLGPAGARMMRQTASVQVNLDFDEEPWLCWRVLNAASPYVTAIFANSPVYAGEQTGFQSTRAAVWAKVDPTRTGIIYDEERPVETYLEFGLAAPSILFPTLDGEYRPFGEWIALANPTLEEWHEHLSTLFPEVRPRGHLELRSIDAIPPEWYAAPISLLAGILYDPGALRTAADLLGVPDPSLLDGAARGGVHHPLIARTAADLFQIALDGCRRLGPDYFHPGDLEQAKDFFERYTRQARAPADDVVENAIAA